MLPTLTTERLVLRPFAPADANCVQQLAGDIRVAEPTTNIPHPYPAGAAEAWINGLGQLFVEGKAITLAISCKTSGELLGAVSLHTLSQQHARADLGYWLRHDYWGRGICAEAVAALIAYAHEQLGTTRIVGVCLSRNRASARVLEKLGLTLEGRLRQHLFHRGKFEDFDVYGLILPGRQSA